MNVAFVTAYNSMPFIQACLPPLIKTWDRVVVIEGSWVEGRSPRSTDGTFEYLSSLKDSISLLKWDIQDPEDYIDEFICSDAHAEEIRKAEHHPYIRGKVHQQQLMALDKTLRYVKSLGDVKWLFGVGSDEIYTEESAENAYEWADLVVGEDGYSICSKTFYFGLEWFHPEIFQRIYRIREGCYFIHDNWMACDDYRYMQPLMIPREVVEMFHYSWSKPREKMDDKFALWNEEAVKTWLERHERKLTGEEKYAGQPVHLFEDTNPIYKTYHLQRFEGKHPESVMELGIWQ